MTPEFYLWFYIITLVLTLCSLFYNLASKKKHLRFNTKDIFFLAVLVTIQVIWLPWTYDTNQLYAESYSYESQAACIKEGEEGIVRSGGFCGEQLFSGTHELTYPIIILGAKKIFGRALGMRILTNILNILTTMMIYLILRFFSKNQLISLALSLSYYLIPFKNQFIKEYSAENLLFLIAFGALTYIIYYRREQKGHYKERIPITFLLIIWSLLITRIEFIFVIPLFISFFISKNKIKIKWTEYFVMFGIAIPLLLILLDLCNSFRMTGFMQFRFFPVMLLTLLIFDFSINRFLRNKDFLREGIFYFIYTLGIIFFLNRASVHDHYTLVEYSKRLCSNWFPEVIRQFTIGSLLFKFLILGGITILLIEIFKSIKNKSNDEFVPFSIALVLISFQIFFVYSYLEPLDIDFRFVVTSMSFFFIPVSIQWAHLFDLKRLDSSRVQRVKRLISLILIIIVTLFLFQIDHPIEGNQSRKSAFEACNTNYPILHYSPSGIQSSYSQTENNVVPIPFSLYSEDEIRKIISEYENICWVKEKGEHHGFSENQQNVLDLLNEWFIESGYGEKIYASDDFEVFLISLPSQRNNTFK
jgi:hypothetical protein